MSGDRKNLQTLKIEEFEFHMEDMDIVRLLGIRIIKNWATTPDFTRKAIDNACDRMFAESLGKVLEKMDSLVSFTLSLPGRIIPRDVLVARAPNLHKLRSLTLHGWLLLKQQQQLLDISHFPLNLTNLKLSYSLLEQDPMPVLEKLPNLKFLQLLLCAYIGKSMSCSTGGFPPLRYLILFDLQNLEEWRVEGGTMPSLTHLTVNWCPKLKMLPEGLQQVTTLRELKLIQMPCKFNVRVRNEVRHIPSIIFQDEIDQR